MEKNETNIKWVQTWKILIHARDYQSMFLSNFKNESKSGVTELFKQRATQQMFLAWGAVRSPSKQPQTIQEEASVAVATKTYHGR